MEGYVECGRCEEHLWVYCEREASQPGGAFIEEAVCPGCQGILASARMDMTMPVVRRIPDDEWAQALKDGKVSRVQPTDEPRR